jgi:hypothetical protein
VSWPWIAAVVVLWLTLLVVIAVLLGLLRRIAGVLEAAEAGIVAGGRGLDLGGAPVGSTVPSFAVSRVNGESASFPELLETTSIAVLMGADCTPCRELLADLRDAPEALDGVPVKVLLEDSPESRSLVGGAPVDVLYVHDRAAAKAFASDATPHAFTVFPGGIVLDRRVPGGLHDLREMARRQGGGAGGES